MNRHSCTLLISNKRGLHARASASLASLAACFPCDIGLGPSPEQLCNAKNILEVMMLAASPGTELHLCAEGEQAAEAVSALQQLVNDRFNEDQDSPTKP
ncbi:HPr family phosphocarrier protein [Thiopseudomonas denitrificans]|uniref:Phosphocarrier protein n=1 Tax=Thiopseudomonas denitrificans TaxID=1501432 RepID=A0A4R6TRU1_9GAMM|nr:HPr family phosphocarrier protein [Thiopseudomonas denitrificans]TDQ36300.1 phosphocarrier protein [Thiopseudomonas denitrificans]